MVPFYQKEVDFQIGCGNKLIFPPHLHQSIELLYARADAIFLTVGTRPYTLSAGDLVIIFPNTVHSYQIDSAEYLLLRDAPTNGGPFANVFSTRRPVCPVLRAAQVHPNVPWVIAELLAEKAAANDRYVNQALMQLLLARVLPCLTLEKAGAGDESDVIAQVMAYIGEHFQEHIALENLATRFGVSKYHLSHLFSARIGLSLPQYVNEFRLSWAASALCATDASITEILNDAGFESQRSFNRAFKARYGVPPRLYQQRH